MASLHRRRVRKRKCGESSPVSLARRGPRKVGQKSDARRHKVSWQLETREHTHGVSGDAIPRRGSTFIRQCPHHAECMQPPVNELYDGMAHEGVHGRADGVADRPELVGH